MNVTVCRCAQTPTTVLASTLAMDLRDAHQITYYSLLLCLNLEIMLLMCIIVLYPTTNWVVLP